VLTCDGDNRAGRMSILIRDGRIAEMAPSAAALTSRYPLASVLDASSRIISPGFVNAHYHAESALLRSVTRGHPLSSWGTLTSLRQATEFLLDPANASSFATLGLFAGIDHVLHGTTTATHILPAADEQALKGAMQGHAASGIRAAYVIRGWNQIRGVKDLIPKGGKCAVAFDTDEDITVYSIEKHLRAAKDLGFPPAFELGETRKGVEALKKNFKKHPLRVVKEAGALLPNSRVAHGNHFTPQDLTLLEDAGVMLTVCAGSAARKRTGCPLLVLLASHDIRLALGTDWGSVDMLEELKFLSLLPLTASGVRQFRPLELVRMATINGAHALGLADETGSLEIGKRADLVMYSLDNMVMPFASETTGADVLAETIIDRMSAGRMTDVMIEGEFRVRNQVPVGVDLAAIETDVRALVQRASPRGIPQPPLFFHARTGEPLVPPAEQSFVREKAGPEQRDSAQTSGMKANLTIITSHPPGEKKDKRPELTKNVKRVFGEDDT
jgi:5-methylthioadenosine/S-adenosylhomocysteine deaminase